MIRFPPGDRVLGSTGCEPRRSVDLLEEDQQSQFVLRGDAAEGPHLAGLASAIPLPMNPMQFTVLTSASPSAVRMLPWVRSITVVFLFNPQTLSSFSTDTLFSVFISMGYAEIFNRVLSSLGKRPNMINFNFIP